MNKTALVTGGTDGIGREVAKGLLEKGYQVVIMGRNEAKAHDFMQSLGKLSSNLTFIQADLSLMKEVKRAVALFKEQYSSLEILVHSAGVIKTKRELTSEGLEVTWATDYLSRFYLTELLLTHLNVFPHARIINIAASGTKNGKIHFDDLIQGRKIGGMRGLGQAQYANDVFTVELARRLNATSINCYALNPGAVDTNIRRELPPLIIRVMSVFFRSSVLTAKDGARAPLYLALSKDLKNTRVGLFNRMKKLPISKDRSNRDTGKKLWDVSKKMIDQIIDN
ncbi:SDR family NAD(P)-dependent oxidoreductase [Metabacillus indicus]|uniref:SDR family NAD(P)-dependent oxidoreductase n=1 Tax=Metabacillus indicus TaxID=246786 RepID=UPI00317F3467